MKHDEWPIDEEAVALAENKVLTANDGDFLQWYPEGRKYSKQELLADATVNTIGVVLSFIGAPILIWHSRRKGDEALKTEALCVYCLGLCCMTTFSLLFNSLAWNERWFPLLQALDMAGIYMMIAGTYTPVVIQSECWTLLIIVWSLVAAGLLWQVLNYGVPIKHRAYPLDIVLFMLIGWSLLPFYGRVTAYLSSWSCWVIVTLGVIYTVGACFNAWQELPYHKAIWHSAVLVATSLTYVIAYVEIAGGLTIGTEWEYPEHGQWE